MQNYYDAESYVSPVKLGPSHASASVSNGTPASTVSNVSSASAALLAAPAPASASASGRSHSPPRSARANGPHSAAAGAASASDVSGGSSRLSVGIANEITSSPRIKRARQESEDKRFTSTLDESVISCMNIEFRDLLSYLRSKLRFPSDTRLLDIAVAFDIGYSVARVAEVFRSSSSK